MRQPDNLPAFCHVHRNGRPLIGYERAADCEVRRGAAPAMGGADDSAEVARMTCERPEALKASVN
jgi:hypothetical protein